MRCDGSERAALELRFAQTYASCIDQPAMHALTRKVRMCCDESELAALELHFAQTYASRIDQPCMCLFSALSAAMGFVVMGADCTNAFDDAHADWYRSRHGNEVDCLLVLPVLKAL
jgi:hypothetical protein